MLSESDLNKHQTVAHAYRIMWLYVLFDLPTNTKKERKDAAHFRKLLLKDGFSMLQYSVYIRHCPSKENVAVHVRRVQTGLPKKGFVSILTITDKQFSLMVNFCGKESEPPPERPLQMELF